MSRSRCHPSTLQEDPGGAATVNPCPCQLPPSTHTGVTGPAPDADPDAERAQASRERSSSPFFSCFPLKTKRADASLGRFLSQEHSPKTSAPGPALTDLTLCGPGGAEGPGVPARGGGAGGAGTHRGCRAPRHSLTRGLTIDGPAAVPGTGGLTRGLPGCPGRGTAPPVSPTPGVTGTRPASPTRPGGGSGVPGEDPAFPRSPCSPGTGPYALRRGRRPQRLRVPLRGTLRVTAPARRGGGHGGHGPPEPLAAASRRQTGPHPLPKPSLRASRYPLQAPPHPETPSGTDNWGRPPNLGGTAPPTTHHPSPLGCHAWPPPPEEMPPPAVPPPRGGQGSGRGGWGPPCPRRPPVPGS